MTYYEILEISEKASQEVIRMAYKALCKKYHPDVYQGDKRFAEEKMKQINEAYETLSDETKKRQYDYSLNSQNQYKQGTRYEPNQESSRQPKQESSSFTVAMLLTSGFMALKDSNWPMAEAFFNQVLIKDAGNAEAYLGKLMAELRVKVRENLKNCSQPFNDRNNYKKAYAFANDSLKNFLKETIQHINKRNYETECQKTYQKACAFMLKNNDIQSFQDAIAEFEKIRDYKDSAKKIEECYKKIAQIRSDILATEVEREKRKEEIKENIKEKEPLFKKIAMVVVPMLMLAIVAASVLPKINWNRKNAIDTLSKEETSSDVSVNVSGDISTDIQSEAESVAASTDIVSSQTSSKTTTNITILNNQSENKQNTNQQNESSKPTIDIGDHVILGDFNCIKLSDNTVELFNYMGSNKNLTIPSVIDGYNVVGIGVSTFWYCDFLVSVTIPEGVTYIGKTAFRHCTSLINVSLPNTLTSIDDEAFWCCSSLESIKIPKSVQKIGKSAFHMCEKLSSITLEGRIECIEEGTFFMCSFESISIPDSVTRIKKDAFNTCCSLVEIKIPNSVQEIDADAFHYALSGPKHIEVHFYSEAQKEKFEHLFIDYYWIEIKIIH